MIPLEVIYEDHDMIVINKPAGIAVHGGISVSGKTLVDMLLEKFPEIRAVGDDPATRPGIVHRLDKDTSGVMVVARTQESFELLKNLFKTRQVEKIYLAIVCGTPKQKIGAITFPIGRLVKNPLKRGVEIPSRIVRPDGHPSVIRGSREAHTEYRVLKSGQTYSLLELKPKTGRMHQLRVHLKALGSPIACDRVYGGKHICCPFPNGRQLLHAQSLAFTFPGMGRLLFEADPSEDFTLAQELMT
ncbi:MAG: RluA family pseudouridine synthase [Candidatus Sungbacteria bacterium]|nr:RluA family pseudouridine synthase [Candidatus Sungbacteria bacterium]